MLGVKQALCAATLGLSVVCGAGAAHADTEPPAVEVEQSPTTEASPSPRELPDVSDWPEGTPPPPGYHWRQKARLGPIIGGSVLLGISWALSAFVGLVATDISHDSSYEWLTVPVAGPFAELPNSHTATGSGFLVVDGAAQFAGLVLLVYGVSSPVSHLERNQPVGLHVTPAPVMLGKSGAGFGLLGTF
jgi:hypothetical protein